MGRADGYRGPFCLVSRGGERMNRMQKEISRRALLRSGSLLGLVALAGGLAAACSGGASSTTSTAPTSAAKPTTAAAAPASTQAAPAKTEQVSLRLGWLANSQYAGDFVALDKGYFKDRGIDLRIDPGGPNIDPVSLTASGSNTIGNVSSIAAMFLARSQGLPVKAFATALQRHPFAFISTKDKNINSPKDFVGKKIGIQATARPLIDAVIAKYNLPRDDVQIVVIGSDTTPLKTGQVDVITAWVIDAPQMAAIGVGAAPLLLWDSGIHLYAFTYCTTDKGWGWMDTQVWDEAIKTYADLGLLKNPITSADAMTQDILNRVGDRPKQ